MRLLLCLLAAFTLTMAQQSLSLNSNYLMLQSDLRDVYRKYDTQPDFDKLKWCLQEGNAGFVFLYCDGLDYSLIFDAQSFLGSAQSGASDYDLLQKINEETAAPSMFQDMLTSGDSMSMISKNTTRQDLSQLQTIITFYRVGDSSSMQVKARKTGFLGTHQVLSAWGSEQYQLYHTKFVSSEREEIRVYYYRTPYASSRVVTELDLIQLADMPSKTSLVYDVYKNQDGVYSIYIVAEYEAYGSAQLAYTLFRHDIENSGNSRSFVKEQLRLGDVCVDKIKVFDQLIVLVCKESGQITFVDRLRMQVLTEQVTLPANEVFSSADNFSEAKSAGETSTEFAFSPDYFKVLGRVGHLQLFMSTWDREAQIYKLRTFEIIANEKQDTPEDGAMSIFVNSGLDDVLSSQTQMQVLTLTDTSVSIFFEDNPSQPSSLPFCFLDESLSATVSMGGISCQQCPLGSYGLTAQSNQCHSCAYLLDESNTILIPSQRQKLQFLCSEKVGQISSDDKGKYRVGAYPSQNRFEREWMEIQVEMGVLKAEDVQWELYETDEGEKEADPIIDSGVLDISDETSTDGGSADGNEGSKDDDQTEGGDEGSQIDQGGQSEQSGSDTSGGTNENGQDEQTGEGDGQSSEGDQNDGNDGSTPLPVDPVKPIEPVEPVEPESDPQPQPQPQPVNPDGKVTEDDAAEDDDFSVITLLIAFLAIAFLVPWIVVAAIQIRKRMRRQHIQKVRDYQQQQMLKITEVGRLIRWRLIGPNGELYADPEIRETRFRRVARYAPEKQSHDCQQAKKQQTTCAICVEDFTDKDIVRVTSCNHVFHSTCLMMWAKSKIWAHQRRVGSPFCPNCNQSLTESPDQVLTGAAHENDQITAVAAVPNLQHGRSNTHARVVPFNDQPLEQTDEQHLNNASPVQLIQTFILDEQGYLSPATHTQQLVLRPVVVESGDPNAADNDFDFQRRAVSSRDHITRNFAAVDADQHSDLNNVSAELVSQNMTQTQQHHHNWTTVKNGGSGGRPPRSGSGPNFIAAGGGGSSAGGATRQYNTIGRMSQNRLDVISEDEVAHLHLNHNRAMLEQVAKNARDNLPECPSDSSSTNAYLARKKRIMEIINQQQAQQSDGYVSVTEQPLFVNIDGASAEQQQRTVDQEGISQHSGRIEATQIVLNQSSNTFMRNGQLNYLSDDPMMTPDSRRRAQAHSSMSKAVHLRANLILDPSGYQSAQQMQILQPVPGGGGAAGDKQLYVLSDAESINDGQAKSYAIVQTHRNQSAQAHSNTEVRQSQTMRSMTLQSQGARAISLNKNLQQRLAFIGPNTPHRLIYNAGSATDNEQATGPYISQPRSQQRHSHSQHMMLKVEPTLNQAGSTDDRPEKQIEQVEDYSVQTKQVAIERNIKASESVKSGFNTSAAGGAPFDVLSEKDAESLVAGEHLLQEESPFKSEVTKIESASKIEANLKAEGFATAECHINDTKDGDEH